MDEKTIDYLRNTVLREADESEQNPVVEGGHLAELLDDSRRCAALEASEKELREKVADLERLFLAAAWFDNDMFSVEDIHPHDGRHFRVWQFTCLKSWDICLDDPLPDDLRAAIDAARGKA